MSSGAAFAATGQWRSTDELVLVRLTEQRALQALWEFQAAPGQPLLVGKGVRGARLVRELSQALGAEAAVQRALQGFARDLSALLAGPFSGWPATLRHAAAVFAGKVADSWELRLRRSAAADATPDEKGALESHWERWLEHRLREQSLWLSLAKEHDFFTEIAKRLGLPKAELNLASRIQAPMVALTLKAAAEQAQQGYFGTVCFGALARLDDAVRRQQLPSEVVQAFCEQLDQRVYRVVDHALESLRDAFTEARAVDAGVGAAEELSAKLKSLWLWTGHSIHVEVFALEQLSPVAWHLSRARDMPRMRRILAPSIELLFSMEARILREPVELMARAAGCAEMLLFWAGVEQPPGEYSALVERALRVCPGHRNARQAMAQILCERAKTRLNFANAANHRNCIQEAAKLLEDARGLFPACRNVEETTLKVAEAKRQWGIP
jgi:hypothetical protein